VKSYSLRQQSRICWVIVAISSLTNIWLVWRVRRITPKQSKLGALRDMYNAREAAA